MRPPVWFFIFLFAFAPPARAERQLLDQVVAVVNDEAITQSELDSLLRPIYDQYKKEYKGEELFRMLNDARRKLLNQLIEDRLVFMEAAKQEIKIEDDEIDPQVEEFQKRFPNPAAMEDALKKEGLTMNDLRERIRKETMVRRLHDMEIRAKVVVSPLEIEDYYQRHPEEFSKQDRLRVRSMTIRKSGEAREKGLTDEAARQKIEELHKRAAAGEDFARLAAENSEDSHTKDGGLGEWVERGSMIPAIDEAIFKLKGKEISGVIETPMGYHFFRIEAREQGRKMSLEEARDEIFARLFQKKAYGRFQEWMTELKRSAYISIR